ncbi:MAG: TaqI-like C-terminal specificity domain-containing protein [Candidatus Peribacteraceae bacterium]|jgi:hypothetical protein|nr:TaqI-like C-terminal specificity domain-containing protein [Candidatus Peribacteraceae bacterium]
MPAPKEILTLVEHFKRKREELKSSHYKEAQLRVEFLDPLLEALGWDVRNTQGHAEAYKEVIHEDAIRIGDAMKAPDYCMRIGRDRKFFVEAKKPSVDIKGEPTPALQLRRYAWSAKLPLSILTDFEEFAIYDCRIRPHKADKASTARIFFCTFEEYAERWDEIAAIFSKEAVLKGSFDKYAGEKRRGTQEVDDEFLKEIEHWRELLAKNIATRNTSLGQQEMNYAVQQTIDRIIFLRICEDRGLETYGRLQAELNGSGIYERLTELFREADARYNSGLFHFKEERGQGEPPDTVTPHIIIDDGVLKEIIACLYPPESPYAFSVISSEILGQVYEQFLGKVIRLTEGHHAKVEEKPEVRKAGGVYYTPKYIVDYIVEHTLGKLLEGKTPKQVTELKIVDPACGSGSFLLGAYQLLLDWHIQYYAEHDPKKWKKEMYSLVIPSSEGGPQWRLTTTERKRILLNNIFGVDIDPQAVEVTKLSLLLKVLEGETGQTVQQQLSSMRERVLPDLGKNIQCGNSLIGPDFYDGEQQTLLNTEDTDRQRINVFDWESAFPQVFKRTTPGFDAVIGNPPYGASLGEGIKQYLISKFKHQNYQLDSYLLFLELAVHTLLDKNGYFGMIIPNPWLTNLLQKKLRKFIIENSKIIEIVHFLFKIFPKVTVDTEIIILQKGRPINSEATTRIVEGVNTRNELAVIRELKHKQKKWASLEGEPINIFLTEEDEKLQNKILKDSEGLNMFFEINVGIKPYQTGKGTPPQSREDVDNRIFDSETKKGSDYRRYLRGKDINRYVLSPIEMRYLKFGPWLAEPRQAANFDAPLKIFMRQTGDSLVAAIDDQKYLCLNNMHVLVPNNDKVNAYFVLGLINSKLMNWYYQSLNPEQGEALAEVKKTNVEKLPIKIIDFGNQHNRQLHDQITDFVAAMMRLQKGFNLSKTPHEQASLKRQIKTTDRKIDELVYELYGLTKEEIDLIESLKK